MSNIKANIKANALHRGSFMDGMLHLLRRSPMKAYLTQYGTDLVTVQHKIKNAAQNADTGSYVPFVLALGESELHAMTQTEADKDWFAALSDKSEKFVWLAFDAEGENGPKGHSVAGNAVRGNLYMLARPEDALKVLETGAKDREEALR